METKVTRNVASVSHPLNRHFVEWTKVNGLPPNRESGLKYARLHPALMKHYSTPKRG